NVAPKQRPSTYRSKVPNDATLLFAMGRRPRQDRGMHLRPVRELHATRSKGAKRWQRPLLGALPGGLLRSAGGATRPALAGLVRYRFTSASHRAGKGTRIDQNILACDVARPSGA